MKKLILILHFAFCILHFAYGQQYGWTDISANLPDFPRDTLIIGSDTSIAMIRAMYFLDDLEGWITANNGSDSCCILHTIDGGESWEVLSNLALPVNAIHMLNHNMGYTGGQSGIIWKTTDGGLTWNFHGTIANTLTDIEFPPQPADTGYACGFNGSISIITPSGTIPMDSHIVGHVFKLSFPVTRNEGWFCGEGGGMIRHFINGNWMGDQVNITGYSNAIQFVDSFNGWVVGDRIKHTTNGYEWLDQTNHEPLTGDLEEIFFININEGWAVGMNGQVFKTSNGGEYWEKVDIGSEDFLLAVQLTSPVRGYIVGHNKAIYKYTQISGMEERGGMEAWGHGSVEVFPNPGRGIYSLQFTNYNLESGVIELMDLNGKTLELWNPGTLKHWNPGTLQLDLSNCPAGVYFVRIALSNSLIVKKIVKI